MRKAGMMGAGNATVTVEGKCVPSSPARCLHVATPPSVLDSAAHHVQMTLSCRSQSSALHPFATHPEESTSWKGKLGTLTPVHSAPVTVAGCCVRRRCAHHCSARTPHAPRTPAAHSVQRTQFQRKWCVTSVGRPMLTRSAGTLTAAHTATACRARPSARLSAAPHCPALSPSRWKEVAARCAQKCMFQSQPMYPSRRKITGERLTWRSPCGPPQVKMTSSISQEIWVTSKWTTEIITGCTRLKTHHWTPLSRLWSP